MQKPAFPLHLFLKKHTEKKKKKGTWWEVQLYFMSQMSKQMLKNKSTIIDTGIMLYFKQSQMPEDKYLPIPAVENTNEMKFLLFCSIRAQVWPESFILMSRSMSQNTTDIQKTKRFLFF